MRSRALIPLFLLVVAGCQTPAASNPAWTSDDEELLGIAITNQSFQRPTIELTVQVDGAEAITDTYRVEGQHALHHYEFEAAAGPRTVTVTSEHGEQATIEVEAGGREPWLYISYRGTEGDEPFNLRTTSDRPAMD